MTEPKEGIQMKQRKYLGGFILAVLLTSAACLTACGECHHSYGNWSVLREVSCTSDGAQSRSCEKCGYTETQTLAALGHSQAPLPAQDATCAAPGLTGGVGCSACGLVLTAPTEVPALPHTVVVIAGVEATCTEEGLSEGRICSVCGITLAAQEPIKKTGHKIVESVGKNPTCTQSGWTAALRCSVCGTFTRAATALAPLKHNYVKLPGVEATCTQSGLKERSYCSRCQTPPTQLVIPALGHNMVTRPAVEATCTQSGKAAGQYCSRCGFGSSEVQTTPALGHSYSSTVTTAATCTQNGTRKYSCTRCGSSYTEAIVLKELAASEVYALAQKSLAEIAVYDKNGDFLGLGTGFVYSSDGKIVTNYHVIDGAWSATVFLGSKSYSATHILAYDKNLDLAILKIKAENLQAATLCTQEHPVGKTVFAVGSSLGLTGTFSQGIITYANRKLDGVSYVQHDAAISGGNSGGPLLNSYGEVIGINSWTLEDSQNLNFAISVRELSKLKETSPKTLSQVMQEEKDAFAILRDTLIQYGTWEKEDQDYSLYLGEGSLEGDILYRYVYYVPEYDCLDFYLFRYDGDTYVATVGLSLYADGSPCEWYYSNLDNNTLYGTLDPATLIKDFRLQLSGNNVYNDSIRRSLQEVAATMLQILCEHMTEDLAFLDISAVDLGFAGY